MDWQGQKLAEQLMQLLLVCFAVVAFITGYALGSFRMMTMIYAAGVVLTSLITIPNWPFFNRHSLNWLDSSEAEKHPKPQPAASVPKKKTSKKIVHDAYATIYHSQISSKPYIEVILNGDSPSKSAIVGCTKKY